MTALTEFRISQKLMGSTFEFIIGDADEAKAMELLQAGSAEVRRIEGLLSEFLDDSVTNGINQNAGIRSVETPAEVYRLIVRSLHLSSLTQGAFDITVKPLKSLYDFRRKNLSIPAKEVLRETLGNIGHKLVRTGKNNRIYLTRKGMAISFASIGKGYAADCVRRLWEANGVKSGVISAGGDLSIIGRKTDGSPWKIGIANPECPSETLLYIPVNKGAVATSGDYEQFFEYQGTRYAHTIDPRTGMPVSGIKSVTVTGTSGELCDALATAVTVMGVDAGMYFINQVPDTHCLIIDDRNKLHFSKNIIFEKAK